jgi:hypothetical protein
MRNLKSRSLLVSFVAMLSVVPACLRTTDTENEVPVTASQPANSTVSDRKTSIEKERNESTRQMEARLKNWQAPEGLQLPPDSIRISSVALEGSWLGRTGMDSARMNITRREDDTFDVEFVAGGCLGRWQLSRTATYSDGILELDRPVQEYCPITFKRLYTIRVDGTELLLPETNVAALMEGLDPNGHSNEGSICVSFYTYGRHETRMRSRYPHLFVDDPKPSDD